MASLGYADSSSTLPRSAENILNGSICSLSVLTWCSLSHCQSTERGGSIEPICDSCPIIYYHSEKDYLLGLLCESTSLYQAGSPKH